MGDRSVGRGRIVEEMRQAQMSRADAERALDATFSAIGRLLDQGEGVTVRGFGTFKRKFQDSRQMRHPRTGEVTVIGPREVTKFREHRDRKR